MPTFESQSRSGVRSRFLFGCSGFFFLIFFLFFFLFFLFFVFRLSEHARDADEGHAHSAGNCGRRRSARHSEDDQSSVWLSSASSAAGLALHQSAAPRLCRLRPSRRRRRTRPSTAQALRGENTTTKNDLPKKKKKQKKNSFQPLNRRRFASMRLLVLLPDCHPPTKYFLLFGILSRESS